LDERDALPGRPAVRDVPALALARPAPADWRACDVARALADLVSPPRAVVFGVEVLLPLPPLDPRLASSRGEFIICVSYTVSSGSRSFNSARPLALRRRAEKGVTASEVF